MTNQEQDQVLKMLVATAEVMGHELKTSTVLIMVDDLAGYDFQAVMVALTRCRRECTGRLTLKMVLDLLAPAGGWLTANEAWSMALPAADERNTVVWTQEASKAWSVAQPLMEVGDKVGARMAFIAAYDRHVGAARSEGRQPVQEISAGWDAAGRELAIQQAQIAGLLPPPAPVMALPKPTAEQQEAMDAGRAKISAGLQQLANRMKVAGEQERSARQDRRAESMQRTNDYFDNLEREGH